jgi:hypothetical protein
MQDCYSLGSSAKAQTASISSGFVPAPLTDEWSELERRWTTCGLPLIGAGRRMGPFMPQIRDASPSAPSLKSIDESFAWIAEHRWGWKQLPQTVNAANRDEAILRRKRFEAARPAWQPGRGRNIAIHMWASSARHLHLQDDAAIAANLLQLSGSEMPPTKNQLEERRRFRTAGKVVQLGDAAWSSLGAWPWAAFDGEMPDRWWEHEIATLSLLSYYASHRNRIDGLVRLLS